MQSKLNRSGRMSARSHKIAFGILLGVLLFSAAQDAGGGTAKDDSLGTREYRNVDYGYSVRVPAGVELETSKPPNPNHGFGIKPTPATLLWVDASYTDDDSLNAVVASERQLLGDNCQELASNPTLLGGLPASRMTLKCAGKAAGDAPTSVTVVVALFSEPHNSRIKYEIGSQGPFEEETNHATEQMFRRVVDGFHLIPRK